MADGLQIITEGERVHATKWNKILRRVVADGTSAAMLGTPSPLEGMPFYNTDTGNVHIYNGTGWIQTTFGRAVGVRAHRPNPAQNISDGSDVTVTFDIAGGGLSIDTEASNLTAGDGIAQSGGDFVLPYEGIYSISLHTFLALPMGAELGGYTTMNVGSATYKEVLASNATTGGIERTLWVAAGTTVNFELTSFTDGSADNSATCHAEMWRVGSSIP